MTDNPSEPQKDGEAQAQSAPAVDPPVRPISKEHDYKLVAVVFLMSLMVLLLIQAPWATETTTASQNQTTPPLATLMFEGYGAAFVFLSLVMGVALIGGLFLAKEDPSDERTKAGKEVSGANGASPKPNEVAAPVNGSANEPADKGNGVNVDGEGGKTQ